jgi:hypothetical protein
MRPHIPDENGKLSFSARFHIAFDASFKGLVRHYKKGVKFMLKKRLLTVSLVVVALGGLFYMLENTKTGLVPKEDMGAINIDVQTPPGTNLGETVEVMEQIAQRLDQIQQVVDQIKNTPDSRRIIVSAWNVAEIDNMALPPCHMLFQFYVADGKLSLQLYQRSADCFLGVPFNIASYALLLMMMAQVCGLEAGEFVHTTGDTHLYLNHMEQAQLQLTREPKKLPTMRLNPEVKNIFDFTYEDFTLENYDAHPHIKAVVSV